MSIYPISITDAATLSTEPNRISPGNMTCVPIDMTTVRMTKILLQQASNTQDYSLRAWLSLYQEGVALADNSIKTYTIMRNVLLPIIIYTAGQTPDAESFSVLVVPNYYFLNILNLTNEVNYFSFIKMDIA